MSNLKKKGDAAGNKTRVQNVDTEQNVSGSTAAILHRVIFTNRHASDIHNFILLDGATEVGIYECPVGTTLSLDFNCKFDTDIRVNPSDVLMDILVMWD